MGRVRAHDYDAKQRAIMKKAAELFARQGFHNTSMAEIAKSCGSSKALLYHYYRSKEALLYQLLSDFMQQVYEASQHALKSGSDPQTALRALARALMRLSTDHHDTYPLLFNEIGALPARQRDQIRSLERQLVAQVTDLLALVRPELGHIAAFRTPLAMAFIGAINWTYHWFDRSGRLSPDTFADLVTDLMLGHASDPTAAALAPTPAPPSERPQRRRPQRNR